MSSLSEVLEGHKPRRVSVRLCPDQQFADRLAQARRLVTDLSAGSQQLEDPQIVQAKDDYDRLVEEADGKLVEFVLVGVGRRVWTSLQNKHQPTPAQRKQYREVGVVLDHNPDTFPVAAIAASLVSPVGDTLSETETLVQKIWDTWNFGECERLWRACLDANTGASELPKSLTGLRTTRSSGHSPEPRTTSESPGPSSRDVNSLAG